MSGSSGLHLDDITIKNLEIFSSSYEGTSKQSLFGVINHTKTSMGSRLLALRLRQPLSDRSEIVSRQDHVSYILAHSDLRAGIVQ